MNRLILAVFTLMILSLVSGPSFALDFIKFGTSHDDAFWGNPDNELPGFPSTVEYLAARGKNEITSLSLTDGNVEDVFNGDFGLFDALVVSENIDLLSQSSYELFNEFVSNGGCLILTGDHAEGEDEFLNNTFGYSVNVTTVMDFIDTFSIQGGAASTQFAGGPSGLSALDLTAVYSNTPGTRIYDGPTGVAVFTDTFGLGTVVAIGWDYCCFESEVVPPNADELVLAWYEVVNRAFIQCFPDQVVTPTKNIPTMSEWGLIATAGVLGFTGIWFAVRKRRARVV